MRFDLRVDNTTRMYVLEGNYNPSIFHISGGASADNLLYLSKEWNHDRFLRHIV
jgi:mannosyltransferase OCH1-like enzyme